MMKLNIAICDDIEYFCEDLNVRLRKIIDLKESVINSFTTSAELLSNFRKIKYDIVFLDVELDDDNNGLNLSAKCKTFNPECLIIYISSYDTYFPEMVNAEPFYFLKKPITDYGLHTALKKALKRINLITNHFTYIYKFNGISYNVNLHDVMYFESSHRIIRGFLINGSIIEFYDKMDNVECEVDKIYPYFIRVNKSYLVNYHHCHIKRTCVEVDELVIKRSRKYNEFINQKYLKIIKDIKL